jgi:hypothetical protein
VLLAVSAAAAPVAVHYFWSDGVLETYMKERARRKRAVGRFLHHGTTVNLGVDARDNPFAGKHWSGGKYVAAQHKRGNLGELRYEQPTLGSR